MKFYEIKHPVNGLISVHGSEFESEAEIRKEWLEKLPAHAQEEIEPRKILIREIPRHRLAVPEQMDDYTDEEMEEIYAKHRAEKEGLR